MISKPFKQLLMRAGFSEVRKVEFLQSNLAEIAIDQAARSSESLYVEAIK